MKLVKKCMWMVLACSLLMGLAGCNSSLKAEESTQTATTEFYMKDEGSDLDYINSKSELVIGYVEFKPMNYHDKEGNFTGFDTECAEKICKNLGWNVQFVPINWDSYDVELETKNIDCIWNAMCITEERKEQVALTDGYLYNRQVMVVRGEEKEDIINNLSEYKLTSEEGSVAEGMIDGSILPEDTSAVSAYDYFYGVSYNSSITMMDALDAVEQKIDDIALVDETLARAECGSDNQYSDLVICEEYDFGDQMYGVAFRKGSDVVPVINEQFEELYKDGTILEIAKKYNLEDRLVQK